jgi:hypothetical protein
VGRGENFAQPAHFTNVKRQPTNINQEPRRYRFAIVWLMPLVPMENSVPRLKTLALATAKKRNPTATIKNIRGCGTFPLIMFTIAIALAIIKMKIADAASPIQRIWFSFIED